MYEDMTYEKIIKRMLNSIPQNIDKREGSIIYDAISASALELANLYLELEIVLNETFADTATREYLIRHASERGLTPFSATNAVLKGEFNINVPIGARFSLEELDYTVTEKITDTVFKLKCETAGSVGNKNLGTLIPIEYIEGLTQASLTEILVPGEDEEDTEVFRKRYLNSLTSIAFGGNKSDYIEKISSIEGVGKVMVNPTYYGGGTVRVVITDADYNAPSDELIEMVQTIVDPIENEGEGVGLAPIGHIVTVEGVTEQTIDIATNLTYQEGSSFETVKDAINDTIDEYFKELAESWGEGEVVVRISQIEMRLLNLEGVLDVGETTLNGSTQNLVLLTEQIPKRGTVSG